MTCVAELPVCLTRGTDYETSVALFSEAYPEVVETPENYEMHYVFRRAQNDALPILLDLLGVWDTDVEGLDPPADLLCHFRATPAETAALPPYNIVYYCELRTVAGDVVARLFQGDVDVGD